VPVANVPKEYLMDQSSAKNYLSTEKEYFSLLEQYFYNRSSTFTEKMYAFPRFVPRQAIAYFLVRYEIFQYVVRLHGSILDFGVYRGSSFFTWLQLSSIFEPYNHVRKVIGFDSFEGFSTLEEADQSAEGMEFSLKRQAGMAFPNGEAELSRGSSLLDMNRPLGHVGKASIVKGPLPQSLVGYLDQHPETIVALANFGLGLYGPTRDSLALLRPRLQRGSVLVFEDLNQAMWPGESKALYEVFQPEEISLQWSPICPHVSWLIFQP